MKDEIRKETKIMQSLLDELKEMQAKLSAIIARLEAEHNTVTATLAEIRRVAVLEEITEPEEW